MRILRCLEASMLLAAVVLSGSIPDSRAQSGAELKPGSPAPQFLLLGSDGRRYSLAEFKGKQAVVLAWFVKAYSAG